MSEDQKTRLAPVVVTRIKVNADIVTPAASAAAMDTVAAIEAHDARIEEIRDVLKKAGIFIEIGRPIVARRHVPIGDDSEATPAAWPADGAGGDGSDG